MQRSLHSLAFVVRVAGLVPVSGWARPISYPGGIAVMAGRDAMADMLHVGYTINKDWAVGWPSTRDRDVDVDRHGPQVTRGWRWNYPDSQANLYLNGGAGAAFVDGHPQPATWGGASIDWEDRRWYAQAGTSDQVVADRPDRLSQSARLGVAPYVAEAGELHSWMMLQSTGRPLLSGPGP